MAEIINQDEQECFLRDIIANPDDDAVRLIYADFLDDHGHSIFADFIRASIELSEIGEMTKAKYHPVNHEIHQKAILANERMWKLVNKNHPITPKQAHGYGCFSLIFSDGTKTGMEIHTYRRGFVDEVKTTWNIWKQKLGWNLTKYLLHPVRKVILVSLGTEDTFQHEVQVDTFCEVSLSGLVSNNYTKSEYPTVKFYYENPNG